MRVIITGGGTGGHIYPAIAIINKIKDKEPNSQVLYIGTHNRMEKDIVPQYDINFTSLKVTGFKRSLSLENFKTLGYFFKAIKKSKKIIKDFKPDIVIGVGGYVTGPVLYAAHRLKIKTFIHEQNSIPGLANKFLSKFVDKIGVSFESSIEHLPKNKTIFTGNPTSEEVAKKKPIDKRKFELDKNKKLVLIVMGSLGSTTVNEILLKLVPKLDKKEYETLIATGKDNYEEFKKKLPKTKNVKVVPYINNMGGLLKVSDLVVSRAGATMISEILVAGIPSIIVPSPYVVDNHQYKNAKDLEEREIAICLEEKDLNKLDIEIEKALNDEKKLKVMKKNAKKAGIKNSATLIYNEIFDLIHND